MGRRGLPKRRKGLYIYTSFSAFSNTHALRQRPSLRKIPIPPNAQAVCVRLPAGLAAASGKIRREKGGYKKDFGLSFAGPF